MTRKAKPRGATPALASAIAIRCDGGDAIGAGHVSRCLSISGALRERGADVCFVGDYDGVASWMLARSGARMESTGPGPCGIDPRRWFGAIVDLYRPDRTGEICELAAALPVATVGEASRCAEAGVWIDYHAGSSPGVDDRRLGGPSFAPLDGRFAADRHERATVGRLLVMAGASRLFDDVAVRLAHAAAEAFPDAEVVAPAAVATTASATVTALPSPFDLAEVATGVDLAVVAAGMTSYELASAGIPVVAVSLVENQRIVTDGCRATGIALGVDGIDRDPIPDVQAALTSLRDPVLRRTVSTAAMTALDGHGADRIAKSLLSAWTHPGAMDLKR